MLVATRNGTTSQQPAQLKCRQDAAGLLYSTCHAVWGCPVFACWMQAMSAHLIETSRALVGFGATGAAGIVAVARWCQALGSAGGSFAGGLEVISTRCARLAIGGVGIDCAWLGNLLVVVVCSNVVAGSHSPVTLGWGAGLGCGGGDASWAGRAGGRLAHAPFVRSLGAGQGLASLQHEQHKQDKQQHGQPGDISTAGVVQDKQALPC